MRVSSHDMGRPMRTGRACGRDPGGEYLCREESRFSLNEIGSLYFLQCIFDGEPDPLRRKML
jgi:hypothetical protein